ncbi:MAG: PAS domain S-box protein [Nitrospirae bacterium]|nr:PAS domain S-box protein [Nitrospirota bacterium]
MMPSDAHTEFFLKRTALLCSAITAVVGAVTIAGWVFDILIIARVRETYIPMAPSTALSFIILSTALFAHIRYPEHRIVRMAAKGGTIMVLCICFVILIEYLTGINLDIEQLLSGSQKVGVITIGRMSPVTAINFLLTAAALLLLFIPRADVQRGKDAASILGIIVVLAGLVLILDYLYGTLVLYGRIKIPVALNTSIVFVFLSIGIIAAAGQYSWPIRLLIGGSLRAKLLRTFLPVTIVMVLIYGWLNTIIFSRIINPSITSALAAIVSVGIVSFVVARISRAIGGEIDRYISERKWAEEELKTAHDNLEKTVTDLRRKEDDLLKLNENLREAELKFHSFASIAVDAIILADTSGTITFWNNGAKSIFGYEEDEAVGKPLTILMPERYREAHSKGIERVRADKKSQYPGKIMELEGLRKDGSEFPVELSITIWPTKSGTFFMGILRDVSKRKQVEAELKERVGELEKFYEMSIGRELKMKELKEDIARLKAELSEYGKE